MSEPRYLSLEQHRNLLSRLRHADELVRVQAAMRLSGLGVDQAVVRPELEAALSNADPHIRKLAAWVLARLSQRAAA
jgi:HEAT repeat protein